LCGQSGGENCSLPIYLAVTLARNWRYHSRISRPDKWPIPDKGLKKRLHRVKAPALIVWGEDDELVSPIYAKEFADRLGNARVEIIADCGHVPQVERLDIVGPLVAGFLDGG
jgi:pimeloyl-ACP methyl ester carboxylesterase